MPAALARALPFAGQVCSLQFPGMLWLGGRESVEEMRKFQLPEPGCASRFSRIEVTVVLHQSGLGRCCPASRLSRRAKRKVASYSAEKVKLPKEGSTETKFPAFKTMNKQDNGEDTVVRCFCSRPDKELLSDTPHTELSRFV